MGRQSWVMSWALALFSYGLYRQREIYMLAVAPKGIPTAYFAHGNATSACKLIEDPVDARFRFCEDMKMLPDDGKAGGQILLSCDPGRREWNTVLGFLIDPKPRGGLWLYSYGSGEPELKKLTFVGFPDSATFHPLGVDTFPDPSGGLRIFATNLGKERATIELFHLPDPRASEPVATYIATVWHPSFLSPNSLAAVSPTSFYVTHDHRWPARLFTPYLSLFETLIKVPRGWVDLVYFDEKKGRVSKLQHVAPNIPFANGISISPDHKTVAVASSTESNIYLYDRDATTNMLKYKTRVHMPQHPDNIDYAKDGTLYVAGHPFFLDLMKVAKGKPGAVSASWITSVTTATEEMQLDADANTLDWQKKWDDHFADSQAPYPHHMRTTIGREHVVKTVYQSDGSLDGGFGTSSSALMDKERRFVFITGLYERGLLQCKMD